MPSTGTRSTPSGRLCRQQGEARACSLFCVYLSALEPPAEIDVDGLPLGKDVERGRSRLAVAVAGALGPAKRQVDLGAYGRGVDVEDPGVEVAHCRERGI